jgi:uncharacterized protein
MLTDGQEQQLELMMESYKQGSGHEISLLTVEDMNGETIERFALEVARTWGLGQEGKHNGALLVVAKSEHKLRIEVGRGLEGMMPDAICGRIIQDVITPAFKRDDFSGGIQLGIVAMHSAIGGDYGPLKRTSRHRSRNGGLGGLLMFPLLILVMMAGGGRGRGGRGGGMGLFNAIMIGSLLSGGRGHSGSSFGGGGGGFSGFGGGGGFSGGGASGGW